MTASHAETTIRTARLLLRRARAPDLAALHAIMSDPPAMRFWSTPPHADLKTTRAFLEATIAAPAELSDDFFVERDGKLIGKVGAWRLPEVGYILARECWGQGYAAEALAAFIAHAFATRTDHLTADVDPRNAASLALLAKLGFHETARVARTWLIADQWCDSVYLRLDRPAADDSSRR